MTKRFIFEQNGNFHTLIDTVENKAMGVFEFKENEFPVYACFHMIIDKMNELHEENQVLKSDLARTKVLYSCLLRLVNGFNGDL